jgi:hypothetical protein
MTTLVYRDGVLAADSRGIRERAINVADLTKVFKLPGNRLVGFVGDCASAHKFIRALREDAMLPALVDTLVVVIDADETITVYQDDSHYEDDAKFSAWGSGVQAALAALYMDATAERAVEIACKVDANSGGPVRSVSLDRTTAAEMMTVGDGACIVCGRAIGSCPSCKEFAPIQPGEPLRIAA